MSRFKIILGFVLLGISLHFFANSLRFGLQLTQNIGVQYATQNTGRAYQVPQPKIQTENLWKSVKKQLKKFSPKEKNVKLITISHETRPAKPVPSAEPKNSASFLQITLEELRPPLKNKALGPEASERLDAFLNQRRMRNADLANETEPLFGARAKREVMRVLIDDEKESYKNARESKSAEEFAESQNKTDEKTNKKLHEIFERHKKLFNRRLTKNTPAWNRFFKQVNDFQKAGD